MAGKKTSGSGGANKPKAKKMPGKSVAQDVVSEYKPSVYLDDKQIPSALKNVKVGQNVTLTVNAKIVGKSQSQNNGQGVSNSLRMEFNQIKPVTKGKG